MLLTEKVVHIILILHFQASEFVFEDALTKVFLMSASSSRTIMPSCNRHALVTAFCGSIVVFVTYGVLVEELISPDALDMITVYSTHSEAIFNHAWTAAKSR